jgi:hypothetical protein
VSVKKESISIEAISFSDKDNHFIEAKLKMPLAIDSSLQLIIDRLVEKMPLKLGGSYTRLSKKRQDLLRSSKILFAK